MLKLLKNWIDLKRLTLIISTRYMNFRES